MNRNEIEQVTRTVLSTILNRQFEPGLTITRENTPEWDSLKHIEIMFALEDELGVSFSEDELVELDTVNKMIDAVEAKYAS
ncbi:MAG: acyl carrier protein [Leptospirales bacterium]